MVAAGGATALGLIPQLWHFALIAEVYTLSILFVALVLACLLAYDSTQATGVAACWTAHLRSLVCACHIAGLTDSRAAAVSRGPSSGLAVRPRELVWMLPLGAALALLPYTYLFWRTAAGAPLLDTRVTGFTSFWEVISGARYSGQMFGVPCTRSSPSVCRSCGATESGNWALPLWSVPLA
jgi:hypothetical protein